MMRLTTLVLAASLGLPLSARALQADEPSLQGTLERSGRFPATTRIHHAHRDGDVLVVDLDLGRPFDPREADALVSAVDHVLGDGVRGVAIRIVGDDGVARPLPELVAMPPVPDKGAPVPPPSHPADHPGWSEGALAGKTIYLSQCHGWYWHDDYEDWYTQRPNLFDTVEDFHNPEGMNQYLMRYVLNAGGRVMTMRESDLNGQMVIVDDTSPGYAESGSWSDSVVAGFAPNQQPYTYDTDPFELGGNRYAETGGGASTRWTPEIPADGRYNVYVSYSQDSSRAPDAHYVVHHPGGDTDVYVDQRKHGSTWVYVGRFWFEQGTSDSRGSVELLSDSTESGSIVSADAVRFGGGVGDVMRGGTTSGFERWEEAAIYYTQFAGAPPSVYDPYGDGDGYDPSSRSRFADWEHEPGEDALYFSWHSNAGGGQGTSTYIYGPCAPGETCDFTGIEGSDVFAEYVQDNVVDAITELWQADWSDRGVRHAYFAEVSPTSNDEMPAALIELAFHDHEEDTALLKHPQFRRDTSRAMMHAMIDYFAWRDGEQPAYPPEPPTHLRVAADGEGRLRVSWQAPPSGLPLGDAAESYRVYLSLDGRSYDDGWDVSDTEALVENVTGYDPIHVRVTAVNDGGESFPTPTLGAVPTPTQTRILLVDGFDRQDRTLLLYRDVGGSVGEVTHMDLERMNRFDFAVEHLAALAGYGVPVDAVASEVIVDSPELAEGYLLVVWMAGNEGTDDESFSDAEQAYVSAHMGAGGRLFVSGAEIGWDLWERGGESDIAFYEDQLYAALAADDAGTYEVQADAQGLFAGLGPLAFDDGTDGYYDVRYPDVLDVLAGAQPVMHYDGDPGMPAALATDDATLVYLGFPFETILGESERATVMADALDFLIPEYVPPEWDDVGDDDDDIVVDDDDDSDDDDAANPPPRPGDEEPGCECSSAGNERPWALGVIVVLGWMALAVRRLRL
jgi:hypothetical protein